MSSYRDNYYGSILDPLHGDIKLSEIEKWCIAQPLFARLRKVKQNTFLYYVFPSANHTRFEHSIGVMHLAGKIFDACKENYATGIQKKLKYDETAISSFFDLDKLGTAEEVFYQELRLAALLHDIGHGPMSHLFDLFAASKEPFLKIISSNPHLAPYLDGFRDLIARNKDKVDHEIISCAFIISTIGDLKAANSGNADKFSGSAKTIIQKISAERIIKMVESSFTGLNHVLQDKEGNDYTDFFSKIISAFPIDADRMDYLLRDSYFAGVTYGMYDTSRIFSSFQATVEDNKVQLTFKESGLDSMLRFIQSRSHLFNQVYFHKTNRAANTMLTYATQTAKENAKLLDASPDFEAFKQFYLVNSDEYFLTTTLKNTMCVHPHEQGVFQDLLDRKLFKRVFEQKIVIPGDHAEISEKIKEIKSVINTKLSHLESQGIFAAADSYENETFKDADKKSIRIAVKDKLSRKYSFITDWKAAGEEFELSDMTVIMVRIYLRRTFDCPDSFKKMRKKITDTVSEEIEFLSRPFWENEPIQEQIVDVIA